MSVIRQLDWVTSIEVGFGSKAPPTFCPLLEANEPWSDYPSGETKQDALPRFRQLIFRPKGLPC
jgi:hypothetical protein